MRLVVVVLLSVLAVGLIYLYLRRDHFGAGGNGQPALTISWSPPVGYPSPSQLQYTWAVCYDKDLTSNGSGSASVCSNLTGKDPSTWPISGTTTNTSVTLNNSNCIYCGQGQVLTFMLMAQDTQTKVVGPWSTSTVDLTSTNPSTVSLNDQTGKPIYIGASSSVLNVMSTNGSYPSSVVGYYSLAVGLSTSKIFPLTITGSSAISGILDWTDSNSWYGTPPGKASSTPIIVLVDIYESDGEDKPVAYNSRTVIKAQSAPVGSPSSITWTLK